MTTDDLDNNIDDNVNVSKSHPLKELAILLFALALALVLIYWCLGLLANYLAKHIPIEWEQKYLPSINLVKRLDGSPTQTDKLNAHITALATKLSATNPNKKYEYRIVVICEKTPNAFALPGGLIVITTGLLTKLRSENALAFVIGHEMGHIERRDHIQAMGRQLVFAVLNGIVLGPGGLGGHIGELLIGLSSLSFSREQELLADDYGLMLLTRAYGGSEGAAEFFVDMEKEDGVVSKVPQFLLTHPHGEERLKRLNGTKKLAPLIPLTLPPIDCPNTNPRA